MVGKNKVDFENQYDNIKSNDVDYPTMEVLVNEHRATMSEILYTQITNRLILVILAMTQVSGLLRSSWQYIMISVISALVAILWLFREARADRHIHRLGELIAEADSNDARVNTFVKWRHELWTDSRRDNLLRSEPMLWLILIIVVMLVAIIFT